MKKLILITAAVLYIQISNAQTVTDIDGNVYQTVIIGTQKWMVENLRTTKFNDGTAIPEVADADAWSNLLTPGICTINNTNNTDTINTYGRLYNWYAINTGKLAPVGWHVPSSEEYETLKKYLIANGYNYDGTTSGDKIAKSLASDTGWQLSSVEGAVGNTDYPEKRNKTGFAALPGGFRDPEGPFIPVGTICNLWCSTESSTDHAYHPVLRYDISNMNNFGGDMRCGLSVRCIEDPIPDSSKYFGQTPPGDTAVIFAPGITPNVEGKIVFSPDGKEICYSTFVNDTSKIYSAKYENGTWSTPAITSFSVNHNVWDPFYSLNGEKLYYSNYVPSTYSISIWMAERTPEGFGVPQALPSPFDPDKDEYYSETNSGVKYFSSFRSGGVGGADIWCIRPTSASKATNPGSKVNSTTDDRYPCVAPDESFIIFASNRSGNTGNQDLWVAFNKDSFTWTSPVNMNAGGTKINIANSFQDYPSLSPDGKFLFFRHGNSDFSIMTIYWVSTHILDTLKKIAFAPKKTRQIPNMNITTDSTINYVIPDNTFSCEYGTNTLKYTATLKNGTALPSWLEFDADTRTLKGTPTQAEIDTIKIVATNIDNESASCTFKIKVTLIVGIDELDGKKIKISPNPTTGLVNVSFGNSVKNAKVEICNLQGTQVFSKTFQNSSTETIDLTGHPTGIYVVKVIAGGMSYEEKILKE
jgi:uncharacterized protein (TIGR02145 family)